VQGATRPNLYPVGDPPPERAEGASGHVRI